MKIALLIAFITVFSITLSASSGSTMPVINGPDVGIIDGNIVVNTGIDNIMDLQDSINSGIEKEIVFRIELLRAVMLWPDDLIVSRKIRRYIGYDILRDQYYVFWKEGGRFLKRYLDRFEEMKPLAFDAKGINLINTKGLDDGRYYVRTIVESKSKQPLRLMGILMYLMPEVEMSLIKESPPFEVRKER